MTNDQAMTNFLMTNDDEMSFWTFGNWDLFGIWDLDIGISDAKRRQVGSSETIRRACHTKFIGVVMKIWSDLHGDMESTAEMTAP